MLNIKLYELKIQELEKKNQDLIRKLEKQELIKEGYKEEITKWNRKYKELRNDIKKDLDTSN